MTNKEVEVQLMDVAQDIGSQVTKVTQLAATLRDSGARSEVLKAAYELTKQVEIIKKQMLKLQKQDNSSAL